MEKLDLRNLVGTFVFAFAAGLFAAPASPVLEAVPTVGGTALAYAPPCEDEWWEYQHSWAEYQQNGSNDYYNVVYLPAKDAYYDCLYG